MKDGAGNMNQITPDAHSKNSPHANNVNDFEALKSHIHGKLVEKLDLTRLSELEGESLRREIRVVVEHLCDTENPMLNRSERERLVEEVLDDGGGRHFLPQRICFEVLGPLP